MRRTVLLVYTSPDSQLVTWWEFVWAVGKGAVVWPLECIVCMLKIKWRNTELGNVRVEMKYFRSRELFLFLVWQMLSS